MRLEHISTQAPEYEVVRVIHLHGEGVASEARRIGEKAVLVQAEGFRPHRSPPLLPQAARWRLFS